MLNSFQELMSLITPLWLPSRVKLIDSLKNTEQKIRLRFAQFNPKHWGYDGTTTLLKKRKITATYDKAFRVGENVGESMEIGQ